MEPTGGRLLPEMDVHLERQMRSQERQLAIVRATIAGAALVAIVLFRDQLSSYEGLAGLAIFVMVYTGGILLLVNRFPAREVGIVATALDMVVVTVAIYIEPQALDAYLFYVPVMLGVASTLRAGGVDLGIGRHGLHVCLGRLPGDLRRRSRAGAPADPDRLSHRAGCGGRAVRAGGHRPGHRERPAPAATGGRGT